MRILFLLTQDLESPSGLGRYLPLAKELNKLGHSVNIATLHSNFSSLEQTQFEIEGVQIDYVAPMHVSKISDQKSYYSNAELLAVVSRATLALSRRALNAQADIIHIAKPHPMNSIAGLLTKYFQNQTLFLDCDDYEAGSGNFQNKWQQKGVAFFERKIPKRVKMVTTNTMFMKDNLISWGVPLDRIIYLPNGVDRDRFSSPDLNKVEALKKELNLEGKKVVAYIGSISLVSHPVDLLIEAFRLVKQALPDSILLLVGGGEDIERLHRQAVDLGISDAVRFCGRVSPSSIPEYFALADVSVDPVQDDSAARGRSPLKLFESWACGVPFVTADVGDRKLLIGEPPAGLLAKPGDQADLCSNILTLLQNPGFARDLANTGRKLVRDYTSKQLAAQLENYYLEYTRRRV